MKKEIKTLKRFLQNVYPENKFSINYIKRYNQIDSGDIIKIKTHVSYEKIYETLLYIVKGICIYKIGEIGAEYRRNIYPTICDIETDADFIEISNTR